MLSIQGNREDPDSATAIVVGRVEKWEPGSTATHAHRKHQLMMATHGVLHVNTSRSEWIVPPSRAIWVSANTTHRVELKKSACASVLYIQPGAFDVPKLEKSFMLDASPLVRELINTCCQFGWDYLLDSPEARIANVLLDQLDQVDQTPLNLPLPKDVRALAVAEAIRKSPGRRESLQVLAKLNHTSARTLERLFINETGLSFGVWRKRVRLITGIEMLAYGQSVSTVAGEVGYSTPSAFVVAFREAFGLTPARYFG